MLKFLVDESSGKKLASSLKEKGYDAEYIDKEFLGADDETILKIAIKEDRILITNDKDFGELIYKNKKHSRGVILLRLNVNNPENRLNMILYVIERFGERLMGKFFVVSESGIRIRSINISPS